MANQTDSKRSLLWGSGSPYAWRVQIALHEKELPYDSQLIEFSKGGHKTEEALKRNPRGQVPTLTDGDIVVCESIAAIIYLEETYSDKGTPLLPSLDQPKHRALVWQRTMEVNNLATALTALLKYTMGGQAADEDTLAKAWGDLEKEVARWETMLATEKTQYIAGPTFTLADVTLVPSVSFLTRGNMDMAKYPCLQNYINIMQARPTVAQTVPPHWKGTSASFLEKK